MPELTFFIGKGGVGKTTVSSAFAVWSAARAPRRPVLLLSSDPAHSLADIFDLRLGTRPQRAPLQRGRLSLWQVDARRQFDRFLRRERESILDLVESGTLFHRHEIEPLLDTTVPGMAEVAVLLALADLLESREYDQIVVDTAPVGHTLRLFELPQHFARFLAFLDAAAGRDQVLAAHFGGRPPSWPFLQEWARTVERVQEAVNGVHSRLVLVTTPEAFALNESVRVARQLAESEAGLEVGSIVLNRVVSRGGRCPVCERRARAAKSAQRFLSRHFRGAPVQVGEDSGSPVLGVRQLLAFGAHVFAGKRLRPPKPPPPSGAPRLERAEWPRLETPLALVVGKGGVGKTTVSAALGYGERRRGRRTATVCSIDPAPSLDDVFQAEVGNRPTSVLGDRGFRALEMDAVAEFRTWSEQVRSRVERGLTSEREGVHIDLTFERRVFSALLDVVPPGVDEIFAVFRILELLEDAPGRLLIDMAPTGHALETLRMPDRLLRWSRLLLKILAAHRTLPLVQDAAVEIAEFSRRAREIAAMLRDRRRSRLWPVMLPEPLPDRETGRLLRELEGLGAPGGEIFINRVLFEEDVGGCRRCRLALLWQRRTLAGLSRRYRRRGLYVIREFPYEIAGARRLKAFTGELWRVR